MTDQPIVEHSESATGVLHASVRFCLQQLLDTAPALFYEVHQLALNPGHVLFCPRGQFPSLVQDDGTMHKAVREIILASVTGEGMDLYLVSATEQVGVDPKGHATVHVHDRTDMPRKLADNTTYVLHCEVGPLELPLEGRIDHLEIKVRS